VAEQVWIPRVRHSIVKISSTGPDAVGHCDDEDGDGHDNKRDEEPLLRVSLVRTGPMLRVPISSPSHTIMLKGKGNKSIGSTRIRIRYTMMWKLILY